MSTQLVNTTNTMPILMGSGNLDAYIQAARRVPILTPEEEYSSWRRIYRKPVISNLHRSWYSRICVL